MESRRFARRMAGSVPDKDRGAPRMVAERSGIFGQTMRMWRNRIGGPLRLQHGMNGLDPRLVTRLVLLTLLQFDRVMVRDMDRTHLDDPTLDAACAGRSGQGDLMRAGV